MTAGNASIISTRHLTKSFGRRRAVDGIDLSVPSGAVYGFLGPNGSGKTTTIRMLLGLISADAGDITIMGESMPRASQKVLPRVGALVEGPAFYPYLTGSANLARLLAVDATSNPRTAKKRANEALERVGLTNAAGKKYRHYSLGMKQRLGIASALLRHRDVLVLDEPMNGLDPQGTREVRLLIRQLNEQGTTVLVSSHLLSEVEHVCSHVGIMSKGQLIRQAPLSELQADVTPTISIHTTESTRHKAITVLADLGLVTSTAPDGSIRVTFTGREPQEVSSALVHGGVDLVGFTVEQRQLEDLFVELTGAGFDVAQ